MDIGNKIIIIGVNTQERRQPQNSEHFFAEIIIIDKTERTLQPKLYEVKRNDYNGFAFMGEVTTINKEKKLIHLANNNTVSYQHLIIASGLSKSVLRSIHDQECTSGLMTLNEAIKIRHNLAPKIFQGSTDKKIHRARKEESLSAKDQIQTLLKDLYTDNSIEKRDRTLGMILSATDKRLYEVLI